ncbi:MAG: ribosome-associated translation inhibitor RaiA [Candidatus Latescibacterota bacterium]|nr:MAG: ribosome-associated translation inhibitor RaiA [Candidatus Latescibacterota bacterium]
MNIKTTARHYQLTPALKDYAEGKIQQLTKYFDNIVNAHIIFALEKYRHAVEVTIHVNGKDFNGRDVSEDMYLSVDRVVEKLERQIQKYKGKRFNKKSPKLAEIGMDLPPEEQKEPAGARENEVVPADPIEFPFMSLDEAVEKLLTDGEGYNIFSNTETKRVNVLFKRDDGSLGLIEA